MIYPPVILVRRDSSQDILGTFALEFGFRKVLFIGNVGLNKTLYCDYKKVSLTLHKSEIKFYTLLLSLSSRRAWIEINCQTKFHQLRWVALLTESVDRNVKLGGTGLLAAVSLSSRRAWIEIDTDGNTVTMNGCRSPHGERG